MLVIQHTAASPALEDCLGAESGLAASENNGMIPDNGLVESDMEFASLGDDYLDWDDSNLDFTDLLNPRTNNETNQCLSAASSIACPSMASTDQRVLTQQATSFPNISIPPTPTYNIRSLIQRTGMNPGTQRTARLMLHTLKSYPVMIQRDNTIPPFIHPCLLSPDDPNSDMEPVTNCIGLVRMMSSGLYGSRKLFWKNVRLECEHFCAEVCLHFHISRDRPHGN